MCLKASRSAGFFSFWFGLSRQCDPFGRSMVLADRLLAALFPGLDTAPIPEHIAIAQVDGPQGRVIGHPAVGRLAVKDQSHIVLATGYLLQEAAELLLDLVIEVSGLMGRDGGYGVRDDFRTAQDVQHGERHLLVLKQRHQALGGDDLAAGNAGGGGAVHGAVVERVDRCHAEVLCFTLGERVCLALPGADLSSAALSSAVPSSAALSSVILANPASPRAALSLPC